VRRFVLQFKDVFMNKSAERNGTAAAWALIIAAIVSIQAAVYGEEPKCNCPLQDTLRDTAFPILGDLPFIGPAFGKNVRVRIEVTPRGEGEPQANGVAEHATARQLIVERRVDSCPCTAQGCTLPGMLPVVKEFARCNCPCACSGATKAASAKCCTEECCEVKASAETAISHEPSTCPCHASWERMLEVVAEKAALEAALEAQGEILEAKTEMFESLAGLMMEKAKLEAKLELQEEKSELTKHVQELTAENAKLKAHAELARQREEMLHKNLQVALENEKLKLRVAELERQEATSRSAKRAEENSAR
jgi:hypothetical protein